MNTSTKIALLLLLSPGCSGAPKPVDPAPRATWAQDVAPLYRDRCVACHRDGGIAPFSLEGYEIARLMGPASAAAVRERVMPPWQVTDDGSCQSFQASRWLSDAEIGTIEDWVEDGMAMGADVSARATEAEDSVGADRLELEMAEPYRPAGTEQYPEDDYRCFLLETALDRDRFITAFEVQPGDPQQVHHVIIYDVDPDLTVGVDGEGRPISNGQVIELLRADTSRPGWSCFGAAGDGVVPTGLSAAWAPGTGVTRYPEGTGLLLQKTHLLVLQVHYHLHGGDETDQTRVHLGLTDQVERPGFMALPDEFLATAFGPNPAMLPPGMPEVPFAFSVPAADLLSQLRAAVGSPNARVFLQGAFPHMHGHGRGMQVSFEQEGAPSTCLADVFRWDFDWQRFYFYRDPILIDDGAKLDVTCHFDTSGETEPVYPGLGSNNEMCLFGMYVVVEP